MVEGVGFEAGGGEGEAVIGWRLYKKLQTWYQWHVKKTMRKFQYGIDIVIS